MQIGKAQGQKTYPSFQHTSKLSRISPHEVVNYNNIKTINILYKGSSCHI